MKRILQLLIILFSIKASAQNFHCGDLLIDSRDGQQYRTVLIGGQCWMQDNLNIGTMVFDTAGQINNLVIEKYCFDNDPANCVTLGGLYTWNESMNHLITPGPHDICPTGWKLPSDDEWKTLELYLGLTQTQADSTGVRGNSQRSQLEVGGSSGFEAKYSGFYNPTSTSFDHQLDGAFFWTSSYYQSNQFPIRRGIYSYYNGIYRGAGTVPGNENYGYCVRCLADNITQIKNTESKSGIDIYPTPATDYLTIDIKNNNEIYVVQLSDLMGRVLYQSGSAQSSLSIDVKDYPNGIYLLQINSIDGKKMLVKQVLIGN